MDWAPNTLSSVSTVPAFRFWVSPASLEQSHSALALSVFLLSLNAFLRIWGSWDISQRPLITVHSIYPGLLPFPIQMMRIPTGTTDLAVGAADSEVLQGGCDRAYIWILREFHQGPDYLWDFPLHWQEVFHPCGCRDSLARLSFTESPPSHTTGGTCHKIYP